ncbi:MAG: hypothetical protein JG781_1409 [Peptococcaceae bacterium]|jgi:hypothetical protein|nr:hypothetical protein [Peptococcaceae bacterium]
MNHKNHGPLHGLLMMLCCLLPIVALIFFAPQFKSSFGGANLTWLFLLACPLMHVLMMFGMRDKGQNCHGEDNNKAKEQKASPVE